MKRNNLRSITIIALMSACCFISFRYFKTPKPITIHLGNVFCLLTALLFGGVEGGICGSIGMGIGDLLDPAHMATFPRTLICKMAMCLTTGYFSHNVYKINETKSKKNLFLSLLFGIIVNIICEFFIGYIFARFITRNNDASLWAYISGKTISVSVTSIITLISTYFLYFPLYNRIKSKYKL